MGTLPDTETSSSCSEGLPISKLETLSIYSCLWRTLNPFYLSLSYAEEGSRTWVCETPSAHFHQVLGIWVARNKALQQCIQDSTYQLNDRIKGPRLLLALCKIWTIHRWRCSSQKRRTIRNLLSLLSFFLNLYISGFQVLNHNELFCNAWCRQDLVEFERLKASVYFWDQILCIRLLLDPDTDSYPAIQIQNTIKGYC